MKYFGQNGIFSVAVIVAALGYFVDVYDLMIFGIVRVASLRDLGVPEDQLMDQGAFLLNMQMAGLLLGGIVWGVLGDKRGRLAVLFGSILLYSLANIANAFVVTVEQYAAARFFAGLGLAGEIGGAMTLVSELVDRRHRGYSTTFIASLGFCGAIFAALIARFADWQTAYIIGGVMGLVLLALRFRVLESHMFEKMKSSKISRGNFLVLFTSWPRFRKYLSCILIGVPTYFFITVFLVFAPELTKDLQAAGTVVVGTAVTISYIGVVLGDVVCGLFSQFVQSRKKALAVFISLMALLSLVYLFTPPGMPPAYFYGLTFALGFSAGFSAVFFTVAAEQFGTNIRSTVATTVPNFVRASTLFITTGFATLKDVLTLGQSALVIGAICFALAFWALRNLEESYGKDLDYTEPTKPI